MPELPEVEVIARGLHSTLAGRTVVSVDPVDMTRLSESAESLVPKVEGRTIKKVYRRAKVLFIQLDNGLTMAFHLKMTGRVVHGPVRPRERHDRILFALDDRTLLCFSDMRRFGYVRTFTPDELEQWDFLKRCGPEPLETAAAVLADRIEGRKARIKALLLDQSVVAGVGNIYADESLFRAGIHPETRAHQISRARRTKLFAELQDVLKQAIAENGSSIRDYVNADGDAGAFQNSFNVYGKKGELCTVCKTVLKAEKVAGRTSTFCSKCQPKGR